MATTPTPKPGRTWTGGDKRRPQILRKAAQLFQKQGFDATSMDEVAAALKINKATIYHHFPGGKSDLLYGINVEALDDLMGRVEAREEPDDPEERLQLAIEDMIAVQVANPDHLVVYYQEARWLKRVLPTKQYRDIREREARFRHYVAGIVADGIERGQFAPRDPEMVATCLVNLVGSSFGALRAFDSAPDAVAAFYRELTLEGIRVR